MESRTAQRSSIDLAAGLARSPQKARQGTEDSCELNSSLFPSFQRGVILSLLFSQKPAVLVRVFQLNI